jgi:hypothetical protein
MKSPQGGKIGVTVGETYEYLLPRSSEWTELVYRAPFKAKHLQDLQVELLFGTDVEIDWIMFPAEKPATDVVAQYPALEPYFSMPAEERISPDEQGFIRRWDLYEPISHPLNTNIVFVDSYVREHLDTGWYKEEIAVAHTLDSKLFNVKLYRYAVGTETGRYGIIFRMMTVIDVPQDIENVRLAVGSNSASMWWIDGEEALILSGDRRMVMDDAASKRLTLKKGRHVITGSVINGPGMSDFCLRFIDEQGNPVLDYQTLK